MAYKAGIFLMATMQVKIVSAEGEQGFVKYRVIPASG